jgi:hypothetical protein
MRNRSAHNPTKAATAAICFGYYLRPPPQFGLLGGHRGAGPSSAFKIGVAIATYVAAKPTIRINILTARCMLVLLTLCGVPGSGTSRLRNYTEQVHLVKRFLEDGRLGLQRCSQAR